MLSTLPVVKSIEIIVVENKSILERVEKLKIGSHIRVKSIRDTLLHWFSIWQKILTICMDTKMVIYTCRINKTAI